MHHKKMLMSPLLINLLIRRGFVGSSQDLIWLLEWLLIASSELPTSRLNNFIQLLPRAYSFVLSIQAFRTSTWNGLFTSPSVAWSWTARWHVQFVGVVIRMNGLGKAIW